MFRIQSAGNVIKTRFAKVSEFATSCFGQLTKDVFYRRTTTFKNAGDYLSDVVFKKSGSIFPEIKATFQGKPLATTKKDLSKQLMSLYLNSEKSDLHSKPSRIKKGISKNISTLEPNNISAISRLSKFFHQTKLEQNVDLELLKSLFIYNRHTLNTFNKILTVNGNVSLKEVVEISDSVHSGNRKYLDILLKFNSKKLDANSIKEYLAKLPLSDKAVEENIDLNRRIREGFQNVDDEKIKAFVQQRLNSGKALNVELGIPRECYVPLEGFESLKKCELLLDAYHCEKADYSMINGETQEYYKFLKEEADPQLADEISANVQLNHFDLKQTHRQLLAISKPDIFYEAVRLEPIKKFIGMYSETEPEMANHLYEKYFLTKMEDCELKNKCIEINKKFGTKVFVDYYTNPRMLDQIYAELEKWTVASEEKAKIPAIFDFCRAKKDFGKDTREAEKEVQKVVLAYARQIDHSLNMPTENFYYHPESTLRHEITHVNDTEFYKTDGTINGIDFDNIKKNKYYAEELKAAGISDDGVNYAYTNKKEFIAVATTGDTREYSDEFKKVLIKLGVPEYAFKLKPLNPPMKIAQTLQDGFINKALAEKIDKKHNIQFPNGIIFAGNGLDLNDVTKWLAEKSLCWSKNVDFSNITREEALRQLMTIAKIAGDDPPTRAIIQIDNFKRFTTPNTENDKFISKLKAFLSCCAEKYKCTVIASVDDASQIDNYLMADHRFNIKIDANGQPL